jgi:hypothetical protein
VRKSEASLDFRKNQEVLAMSDKPILPPETVKPTTEAELTIAFAGPAYNTNKMFASNMPTGLRLSFCEMRTPEGHDLQVRTAVLISYPDAASLRNLLTRQLEALQSFVAGEPKKNDN